MNNSYSQVEMYDTFTPCTCEIQVLHFYISTGIIAEYIICWFSEFVEYFIAETNLCDSMQFLK